MFWRKVGVVVVVFALFVVAAQYVVFPAINWVARSYARWRAANSAVAAPHSSKAQSATPVSFETATLARPKLPTPIKYSVNPKDIGKYDPPYPEECYAPHRRFNENMDLADMYTKNNPSQMFIAPSEEPIRSALEGFDEMYRNRKVLGLSDRVFRGAYEKRLYHFYNWASKSYDAETEAMLKKYAKLSKVKYVKPRYW